MSKNNWKKYNEFKKKRDKELAIIEDKKMISIDDLINISIEIWRIKKRINKNENQFSEQLLKWVDFSYEKIKWIISSYNIDLKDIQWERYSDDMAGLEIISADIDENLNNQVIIKEMIEPIVMLNWKLRIKGKVIIWNK